MARGCGACGHENPPDHRFCGGCGSSLEGAAAAAAPVARTPRDYTPKHLADKILQSKSALEGERKQVTVLFADIQGSMDLADQLDPEEWHHILERFFEILADGVHRFEGTVNQYLGDGIMALFGAPIAHEDHAQRACYAALRLREEIERYATEVKRERGVGFSTRMGLHSGEVIVGKIGDDLRMDYTAQGHTVGLAQRMESLASPDTCYLTDTTAELVRGYFELEDLGEFNVKGAREPLSVHRLLGAGSAHTRFDISRARGLTRFVGRDDDMQTLTTALGQARAGNGQVVGVVAEAGTGKSRLCFEFVERCRGDGLDVYEAHAVAHGKNIPYLPMLELFRSYFGIEASEGDRVARDRIAGRLLQMDEKFRALLPVLFEFMGVPDPERPAPALDPEGRLRQLYGIARRVMQGNAGLLTVSLMEDAHWMDPGSEAFLEQLVEAVPGTQTLLLVNFRPEFHAPWMQKTYYRQLPLAPLGPDAIRELLDDLLGGDASIGGLAQAIHARTGGNPFYTEEVVRSLIESGHLEGTRGAYRLVTAIDRLGIPHSVQAILAARIDRLAEREKQVLQAAAVIGKEFPESILAEVVELPTDDLQAALAELRGAEFVYEQSLYPVVEYAFKHPLTQEVALHSQLAERRRGVHARVARAIEAASAERPDDRAALLAHHWEEAGEAREAVLWHRRAAVWIGASDPTAGIHHWERVRALAAQLDGEPEFDGLRLTAARRVLLGGVWRLGMSEKATEAIAAEGRTLAERLGRPGDAAAMFAGIANHLGVVQGAVGPAMRSGERALEVLAAANLLEDRAHLDVHIPSIYYTYQAGRLPTALEHLERVKALTGDDMRIGLETLSYSIWGLVRGLEALVLGQMGRPVDALVRLDGVLPAMRDVGAQDNVIWTLSWPAEIALWGGGFDARAGVDPRRGCAEALELAEQLGNLFSECIAHLNLGFALLAGGELAAAEAQLVRTLERSREANTMAESRPAALCWLAAARRGQGDLDGALAAAREAVALSDAGDALLYGALARLELACALTGSGAPVAEVRKLLAESRALVESSGGGAVAPRISEAAARLAAREGQRDVARRGLEAAEREFRALGLTPNADRLAREL